MSKKTKKSEKKLVLVTGGAGFIGGHLVDRLLEEGYSVRVLDNLGAPTHNGKLPAWFNKKADFQKGDVRNKKDWVRALRDVTYVFHLASYMDFHMDFSNYIDTNAKSTALMYEVIVEKKYKVKKIILASSQSVYGEGIYRCRKHGVQNPHPRPEKQLKNKEWELICPIDGLPLTPVAQKEGDKLVPTIPYGISKKTSEELVFNLGSLYNIPSVALRYTIVHGTRQSFRHFYSGALRQIAVMALSGGDLMLHEDGRQIRDYVNIHDVISAHILVLRSRKANFEAFNVGSGRQTRVRNLAATIKGVTKVSSKIETSGLYRVGAPRHSPSDISKLKKIGYKPKVSLVESTAEYIDWIRKFPEAKRFLKATLQTMKKKKLLR